MDFAAVEEITVLVKGHESKGHVVQAQWTTFRLVVDDFTADAHENRSLDAETTIGTQLELILG